MGVAWCCRSTCQRYLHVGSTQSLA
jgi:hypothetical protein